MEKPIILDGQGWTKDYFKDMFNFGQNETGFTKEVNGSKYTFREVSSADELKAVVNVQKISWGWDDRELAPVHILALMKDTGGGVFAAYDQINVMVGFAAGFGGGIDPITNQPILISSMLAMAGENLRSKGIGKELKTVQAYHAFQNGYSMMKWLYDPERGENASLNLSKLGAMAEEFYINKYGEMSSELYGPVPTDRFRAVWRFTEKNVLSRVLGENRPLRLDEIVDIPIARIDYMPPSDKVLVEISADIDKELERDKIDRRFRLRKILANYFLKKGYIATEFISEKNENNRKSFYLLEPMQNVIQRGDITVPLYRS